MRLTIAGVVFSLGLPLILLLHGCTTEPKTRQAPDQRLDLTESQPPPAVTRPTVPPPAPDELLVDAQAPEEERPLPESEVYTGTGVFLNPQAVTGRRPRAGKAGEVILNFESADVREVVATIIGDILNENYLMDPDLKGSVTLQTTRPVSPTDALSILESVLEMNGIALIRANGLYKIMPMAKVVGSTIPPTVGTRLGPHRGFQTKIVPLKYISAREMKKILDPLASKESAPRADEDRNLLVLSGTSDELENMLSLVDLFDVDWLRGMSVGLITIDYSDPNAVAAELGTIFGSEAEGPLAGMLRFFPMERLNAVLVISPQPRYLEDARTWIERLDRPSGGEGRRLYVYRVQNGRAEDLGAVLSELFGAQAPPERGAGPVQLAPGLTPFSASSLSSDREGAPTTAQPNPRPDTARANQAAPSSAAAPASQAVRISGTSVPGQPDTGAEDFSSVGEVGIIAEPNNNALVILATPSDYAKIELAIKRLDVIPLQVFIEATIYDVTLGDDLSFGVQWEFNNSFGDDYRGTGTVGSALGSGQTFGYLLRNAAGAIKAELRARAEERRAKVISAPTLMVLDNQTANIRVGNQQPITQSTFSSTGDVISESVQFKDTGVLLEVTPRVNAGGLVTLDIGQEVTDVGDIDAATGQRSFLQRSIRSTVAVQSGETIVLGGLIRENDSKTENGVPGLYKIPILGKLFGQTITGSTRTELVMMLTPRAVRSLDEARQVTEEYKQRLKRLQALVGPMAQAAPAETEKLPSIESNEKALASRQMEFIPLTVGEERRVVAPSP